MMHKRLDELSRGSTSQERISDAYQTMPHDKQSTTTKDSQHLLDKSLMDKSQGRSSYRQDSREANSTSH